MMDFKEKILHALGWHFWDGHTELDYYPRPQCIFCDKPYQWWRLGSEYRGIPAARYAERKQLTKGA